MIFSENRYPLSGIMLYCVTNVPVVCAFLSERHNRGIAAMRGRDCDQLSAHGRLRATIGRQRRSWKRSRVVGCLSASPLKPASGGRSPEIVPSIGIHTRFRSGACSGH